MQVHLQPLALADGADDGVAGDGLAAARELHGDALRTADEDGAGGLRLDHVGAAGLLILGLGDAALDAFFDHVTVNAPEPALRENRLFLLARVRRAMDQVADFSKLEG